MNIREVRITNKQGHRLGGLVLREVRTTVANHEQLDLHVKRIIAACHLVESEVFKKQMVEQKLAGIISGAAREREVLGGNRSCCWTGSQVAPRGASFQAHRGRTVKNVTGQGVSLPIFKPRFKNEFIDVWRCIVLVRLVCVAWALRRLSIVTGVSERASAIHLPPHQQQQQQQQQQPWPPPRTTQ
jgi:hypothetical protein